MPVVPGQPGTALRGPLDPAGSAGTHVRTMGHHDEEPFSDRALRAPATAGAPVSRLAEVPMRLSVAFKPREGNGLSCTD